MRIRRARQEQRLRAIRSIVCSEKIITDGHAGHPSADPPWAAASLVWKATLGEISVGPTTTLSNEQREGIIGILSTLLSDEYVLYTKARNYHRNVGGPQLSDLQKLLAGHYEQLEEVVEDVAQRTRSLGGSGFGPMTGFIQGARLKEQPQERPEVRDMLRNLLADHESLVHLLRSDREICNEKFHDGPTNEFLTGLMERHERMTWMLKAVLKGFFDDEPN